MEARVISSRKEERVAASKILPQPQVPTFSGNRDELVQAVHDALYASKIVSYAQGMELTRCRQHSLQLEFEFWGHRDDLAWRVHHSREIS